MLEAIEVFNFKDKESLVKFFNATNKCEEFIAIFETKKSLEVQTRKFIKCINGLIHECFKKVKIYSKLYPQLDKLYDTKKGILEQRMMKRTLKNLKLWNKNWLQNILKVCLIKFIKI